MNAEVLYPKETKKIKVSVRKSNFVENIFHVISSSHSRNIFERHDHVLREFLECFSKGYFIRDIQYINIILGNLLERRNEYQPYYYYALGIIKIFGKEYLWKEANYNDEKEIIPVSNFISHLGYLILNKDENIRNQASDALLNRLCLKNENYNSTEIQYSFCQPVSEDYVLKCFEESTICDSLLILLKNDDTSVELLMEALIILNFLTKSSERISELVLKKNGIYILCLLLNSSHSSDCVRQYREKSWSFQILWNLIQFDISCFSEYLSSANSRLLRDAFFTVLHQSDGIKYKQLRNDFLNLFCLVLDYNCSFTLMVPGFTKELILLATYPEVKHHYATIEHLKLLDIEEDYEMKQLCLIILMHLGPKLTKQQMLYPEKLIDALLMYINPLNEEVQGTSFIYKRTLQRLALKLLVAFASEFITYFFHCGVIEIIIEQIHWCIRQDVLTRENYIYERDVYLRYCLLIILQILKTHDSTCVEELIHMRVISILQVILTDLLETRFNVTCIDSVSEIQLYSFCILALLCDTKVEFKALIGTNGEELLIKYLKHIYHIRNSGLPFYNLILSALIQCLWCCISGVVDMEQKFLDETGMTSFLDIITIVDLPIQSFMLALLMDLCESNVSIVQSTLDWRSSDNITFPEFLCMLWQKEEQLMGVVRDKNHSIIDPQNPLFTAFQSTIPLISQSSDKLSPAILDVSENIRANVYGLIEKMKAVGRRGPGMIHPPELMQLPLPYMSTLALIEGYFDHKAGEVWLEILTELRIDSLQPLPVDQEYLYSVLRTNLNRGYSTLAFQNQFHELMNEQNRAEENHFYNEMLSSKNQEKINIERFYQFLAKTSDYSVLRSLKEKRQLQFDLQQLKISIRRLEIMKSGYSSKPRLPY